MMKSPRFKNIILRALILLLTSATAGAVTPDNQMRYKPEDVSRLEEVLPKVKAMDGLTPGERLAATARLFMDTPYVAGSLEIEPEMLTFSLTGTDCILFVEMCVALGLTADNGGSGIEDYAEEVRQLRYRDGTVDGYASRLHYTSEWMAQAEARGILREITSEIGGIPFDQKFNFMSTHPQAYKQLSDSPSETARIRKAEKALEARQYHYIPKDALTASLDKLQDGDIVCFTCGISGLDIAHLGIALHDRDGRLTFIHASSTGKKVLIQKGTIGSYISGIKRFTGLRVIRPL